MLPEVKKKFFRKGAQVYVTAFEIASLFNIHYSNINFTVVGSILLSRSANGLGQIDPLTLFIHLFIIVNVNKCGVYDYMQNYIVVIKISE